MRKRQVQYLVREDPTNHRATKTECYSSWDVLWSPGATAAEPLRHNYWRPCTLEATPRSEIREASTMRSHCAAAKERHPLSITRQKLAQQRRPSTSEKQKIKCCERNSAISYLLISRTLNKAFVAPDLLL